MKTTIEIDDGLLKAAKKLAIDEGVTLRALIDRSLRTAVAAAGDLDGDRDPGPTPREVARRLLDELDRDGLSGPVSQTSSTLPLIYDDPDLSLKVEEVLAERWRDD